MIPCTQAPKEIPPVASRKEIDLQTSRVEHVLCHCNHPERQLKVIHVAGTNGKGSTCAYLFAGLNQICSKVAFFSSPPLVDPNDTWHMRTSLGERVATQEEYQRFCEEVLGHAKALRMEPMLTSFETSFLGFLLWSCAHTVEMAIIEVGLGGTHDATNVFFPWPCKHPPAAATGGTLASVVTKIALDHTAVLGPTLEQIATHKAGILHTAPCFVGLQEHNSVYDVIRQKATHLALPYVVAILRVDTNDLDHDIEFQVLRPHDATNSSSSHERWRLDALAKTVGYQKQNFALACVALQHLFPNRISYATLLDDAYWPGRLDWVHLPGLHLDMKVLVDGAHNPDGASQLNKALLQHYLMTTTPCRTTPLHLVWILAHVATKPDFKSFVHHLLDPFPLVQHHVIYSGFSIPHEMAWIQPALPSTLATLVKETLLRIECAHQVERVWEIDPAWLQNADMVIITGSLYLVSDVYRWINMEKEKGKK